MGQNLNTSALKILPTVLKKPSLMVPTFTTKLIADIQWNDLKQHGRDIKYIVFDKDNTLTAPYASEIHNRVGISLQECVSIFGKENICIISNSAGSSDDVNFQKANEISKLLGINVLKHGSKKPNEKCFAAILSQFNIKALERNKYRKILVVGDRILTDVVFGNLFGCSTLLCTQILSSVNDNKPAAAIRRLEHLSLPYICVLAQKTPENIDVLSQQER